MDLYCPNCAEPWDNDSLHEEAEESDRTYDVVATDFRRQGCNALTAFGTACAPTNTLASATIAATYDMLGDDMDGAAAMFDDFLD